jgi:alpha-tubulin suppressor-like RCC1 family protein
VTVLSGGHPLANVVAIAAGGNEEGGQNEQSLALLGDGTVVAWGSNEYGQLGIGSKVDRHEAAKVKVLTNVRAIAAGGKHSLALLESGHVMSWGWNAQGQLGRGTSKEGLVKCGETEPSCSLEPREVMGVSTATQIAAGWFYSVALLANGTLTTWGWNGYDETRG